MSFYYGIKKKNILAVLYSRIEEKVKKNCDNTVDIYKKRQMSFVFKIIDKNCIMDLEDQIDLFCIRKPDLNSYSDDKIETQNGYKIKQSNIKEKVHNYIPLLIKHVQTLNDDCIDKTTNITKVFDWKIQFKHCLVYGKILGNCKETKISYSYLLDDGSGSLKINIFKKTKELQNLWKMENELENCKQYMFAQNKYEIVKSLRNLLLKTKEQMDYSNISIGSKVLVYGRPSFYLGQTFLEIYYVTQDVDCNMEITFKDYLIEWYSKNILKD